MALILASASPRRRELLGLITPEFTVCTASVDEGNFKASDPAQLARLLATEKCKAVAAGHPQDCVIGADTVVDCDGTVLGKPRDARDAAEMLHMLSGRQHRVHTGICVIAPQGTVDGVETTQVQFASLSEREIDAYVTTPEPYDKAGGYGIQGLAARFVTKIDGCYYNVMGFPVRRIYEILNRLGQLPG